jgi:glycosyltransferase involved in cell wall biosynthesis
MSKPTFVISCPINTYSGYGARSRDIVKAIIELDKYDVKILPQRWGSTPQGFIKDNPEWEFLTKHLLNSPQLPSQPEIWMQITVPNEFQPIGKYNIGCTAGIETTIAPADWIEGCSRMNLILGSSEHTIKVLKESKFEKRDQQTNQTVGYVEWKGDSEIIFEGANTEVYKPTKSTFDLSNIKEEFAYLFVGHWMQGNLGEDRKNVGLLVKAFYETFKNKSKKPALILKTSQVGSSYMDRDELIKRIKMIKDSVKSTNLPNVYLLHGEFTDNEINEIYNHSKVKAMVNLTKGEGFGRPLLEFSTTGKPIIAPHYSGQADFLKKDFICALPGGMTDIHDTARNEFLIKGAKWFTPDYGYAGKMFKEVQKNYKKWQELAKRQRYFVNSTFTKTAVASVYENILNIVDENLQAIPKPIELKLPSLKKIEA